MSDAPLIDYIERYPAAAGFKQHGSTSEAAARIISVTIKPLQQKVLDCFKLHGSMTPDECASRLGKSLPHGTRSRCSELRRMGLLRPTGQVRVNEISGLKAEVLTL